MPELATGMLYTLTVALVARQELSAYNCHPMYLSRPLRPAMQHDAILGYALQRPLRQPTLLLA